MNCGGGGINALQGRLLFEQLLPIKVAGSIYRRYRANRCRVIYEFETLKPDPLDTGEDTHSLNPCPPRRNWR